MSASASAPVTAGGVRERPHPNRMALPCIWDEVDELIEYLEACSSPDLDDAINQRFSRIVTVLERRLDADYPRCPDCGAPSLGLSEDGVVVCWDGGVCEVTDDARDEYMTEYRRIWGTRGHGRLAGR